MRVPPTPTGRCPGTDERLRRVLARTGPVVVAFSGGVDSALLAHAALGALGPGRVLAVTAVSPSLAGGEADHCARLADTWGLPWLAVRTAETDDPAYRANGPDRCGRCKDALMDRLLPVATARRATVVLGVNVDDLGDHRPGQSVAASRGARFPLVDADLTKAAVRDLARHRGLEVWDRPARPCLASRVPHGTPVTVDLLRRVDRAEAGVLALGFSDVRVRHHGDRASVEVPVDELGRAGRMQRELHAAVRAAGYREMTVAADGLRSGRLTAHLRPGSGAGSEAGTGSGAGSEAGTGSRTGATGG